jgi:hypothetical protein
VSWACGEALEEMGRTAVEPLLDVLVHGNEGAREGSAWALCRIMPDSTEAIAALINALGDSSEEVRLASVNALAAIGRPALPALVSSLKHENELVRAESARAIGEMNLDAKDAMPALVESLCDTSPAVRFESARALNRIKALEEEAQEILAEAKASSQAKAEMNHVGHAGPRRERTRGLDIITRVRDAGRVLAGVRPAEVSFDELDRCIGVQCAVAAAHMITSLLVPDADTIGAYYAVHRQVTRFVLKAIEDYASFEVWNGRHCREAMRRRARQAPREEQGPSDIPF